MMHVGKLYMIEFMSEKHERLRQARIDAGYGSAQSAADALGITASTYRAHENGQNDFGLEEAQIYGRKFSVDPIWIMTNAVSQSKATVAEGSIPSNIVSLREVPNAEIGEKVKAAGPKIPVFGQAVGGVDGEFIMNGSILYEVMAPPTISDISGAYAVSIAGDSMTPRYDDGEIAFIDPSRRVRKGDYVVAQIRYEEEGPILAFVKKFVRHNADELVLEQFNPPKQLTFPHHNVVSVHYIAMAGNA
jgi:phage repressor protein C with HTH and peptisase S24 domain